LARPGGAVELMLFEDLARFGPHDPDGVVAASLACPFCLHRPTECAVDATEILPYAECWCEECGVPWIVHLDELQAFRLCLLPPIGVVVHNVSAGTVRRRAS
jgi:hypothetical protein